MIHLMKRSVCVLLVALILSSTVVLGEADDYALSFDDPQEFPDYPDLDLKSLNSRLEGDVVVVELRTYGNISDEPGYFYSISSTYFGDNSFCWFGFYISEGNGTFDYTTGRDTTQLWDIWEIVDNVLIVRIPVLYAGPPENFNLSASANYYSADYSDSQYDSINTIEIPFYSTEYNFDDPMPLSVPGFVRGQADEGENLVYSLELVAGTGVLIELNGSFGSWPYFTVFNSERQHVTGSMSDGRSSKLTFIPETNGTYYIGIDGWSVSGSYKITTSLRGLSGEGYERAAPDNVPWTIGNEWSAGGYMSTEDIVALLYAEAGMYSMFMPKFTTEGGLADFLVVTYAGQDGDDYRFDFKCRIYCDMTLNMTMSESMYSEDESFEMEMYMNTSGILDISYNGSIWLGYYENIAGDAYYGIERQTLHLSGDLDVAMGMAFQDSYMGGEDGYYKSEMRAWGNISLELAMESTPGIPYLPAKDASLSVDKKTTTAYIGHIGADIKMSDESNEEDYPIMDPDDMNYSLDCDFEDSFIGYHMLEYDSETKQAIAVSAITDPSPFLSMAMYHSYDYTEDMGMENTYLLEYWTSGATFDPKTGFYSAFELPLNPLSGGALPLEPGAGDTSMLSSIGMMGLTANLVMGRVKQSDAQNFFEDPAEFIRMKEAGGSSSAPIIIALAIGLFATMAAVLFIAQRRLGKKPENPPPEGETAYPGQSLSK